MRNARIQALFGHISASQNFVHFYSVDFAPDVHQRGVGVADFLKHLIREGFLVSRQTGVAGESAP